MSDSSWKTVAMPARRALDAASRGSVRRPAQRDVALIRGDGAAEDPDERALAGAVLAEDGVHFAGVRGEVHLVEGDDAAEALADATPRASQRVDPIRTARSGVSRQYRPLPAA